MKRYKPRHKELIDYVDNNEAIEAQVGSTILISLEDVDIIIDRVKNSVVSGSLSGWITIKNESDLPSDDYCGKVEFKMKGETKTIVGYYEEVYQTFEDDGTDKKNDCCVSWEEVDSYRCDGKNKLEL